jgi:hypothetical protein
MVKVSIELVENGFISTYRLLAGIGIFETKSVKVPLKTDLLVLGRSSNSS